MGVWHLAGVARQDQRRCADRFPAYISRFYTRLDSMSRIVSVTQNPASGAKRIFDNPRPRFHRA